MPRGLRHDLFQFKGLSTVRSMMSDNSNGTEEKGHIRLDNSPDCQFSESKDFVLVTALSPHLAQ